MMQSSPLPSGDSQHHIPVSDSGFCGISYGTSEYRRSALALFLVGFSTFSLIYCVQPLLPAFTKDFHISPAESSLTLSLTTGFLAIAIVLAGAFSASLQRKSLMMFSMTFASVLTFFLAFISDWSLFLAVRSLEGFVLGGVPAIAMVWLAEEIRPEDLGRAMGIYVAGTAFGAMIGRVGMGLLTEFMTWKMSLGVLGILCLISAVGFLFLLPPSRNFSPTKGMTFSNHLGIWKKHLSNPHLRRMYAIGFILTSIFVTVFNYSTFHLSYFPYYFSQTQISLIFLAFGFGIVTSSVAGRLSDRFGRRSLLIAGFMMVLFGVLLTFFDSTLAILAGIASITSGFFVGHSVASSSVGRLSQGFKGHATALYLLFYYMGASIIGSVGGWFWEYGGWNYIVYLTAGLTGLGLLLSFLPHKKNSEPSHY